jgi:Tol biopolymer transport system component
LIPNKLRLKTAIVILAITGAASVLAYAWVVHTSARAFWDKTVSFSCSYVPPLFDRLVYTRMDYRSGNYQIVIQERPNGKVMVLTPFERTAMHGVSNGEQVIYHRLIGNQFDIVQGPLSGERVVSDNTHQIRILGTTITPDGNFVVFKSEGQIFINDLHRKSYELFRLTIDPQSPPSQIWEAAISPKLNEVAVTASEAKSFTLRVYARGTTPGRLLHRSDRIIMRPKWLPDGSAVTFVEQLEKGWAVMLAKISDGGRRVLYSGMTFIETAELHPDQAHLLLTLGENPEWEGYFSGLHVYEMDLHNAKMARVGY